MSQPPPAPPTPTTSSSYAEAIRRSNEDEKEKSQNREPEWQQQPPRQRQGQSYQQQRQSASFTHPSRPQDQTRPGNFRHHEHHRQSNHNCDSRSLNYINDSNFRHYSNQQQFKLREGPAWGGRRSHNDDPSFRRPQQQRQTHHQQHHQQQQQRDLRNVGSQPSAHRTPQRQAPMAWGGGGARRGAGRGVGGGISDGGTVKRTPLTPTSPATLSDREQPPPHHQPQQQQQPQQQPFQQQQQQQVGGLNRQNHVQPPHQQQQAVKKPGNKSNNAGPAHKKPAANKKRTKTKPTLKTMCLGDLISLPTLKKELQPQDQGPKKQNPSSLVKELDQVGVFDRHAEFPALGAASSDGAAMPSTETTGPSLPAAGTSKLQRPAWGIVAPAPLAPKAPVSTPVLSTVIAAQSNNSPSRPAGKNSGASSETRTIRVLKRGEPFPVKKEKNLISAATEARAGRANSDSIGDIKLENTGSSVKRMAEVVNRPGDDVAVFRWGDGEEHQLMRLMMMKQQQRGGDGGHGKRRDPAANLFAMTKGRQRLAPRKKRFTALKKKVLMERLKRWSELHPKEEQAEGVTANEPTNKDSDGNVTGAIRDAGLTPTKIVCVFGFVADIAELQDTDEYQEIVMNLQDFAFKIGPVENVFVPCPPAEEQEGQASAGMKLGDIDTAQPDRATIEKTIFAKIDSNEKGIPVFVKFHAMTDAAAAQACWNGLVLGGESLQAFFIPERDSEAGEFKGGDVDGGSSNQTWSTSLVEAAIAVKDSLQSSLNIEAETPMSGSMTLMLENVLTDDDLEDDECMTESLQDISKLVQKYGVVVNMKVVDGNSRDVEVCYEGLSVESARRIVEQLRLDMLGGTPVLARVIEGPRKDEYRTGIVTLTNALTDDDMEDEECLEETLKDIREIAGRHGHVSKLSADLGTRAVHIEYPDGLRIARQAVEAFDGLCLGGMTIVAKLKYGEQQMDGMSQIASTAQDLDYDICLVYLHNLLTEDDMEDGDCMEESLSDARELAMQFGEVVSIDVIRGTGSAKDSQPGVIALRYKGPRTVGEVAANGFNGMVIGGQTVSAVFQPRSEAFPGQNVMNTQKHESPTKVPEGAPASASKKARTDDLPPLYSGDKLISERFAECKRAPKIPNPNSGAPRDYASLAKDERVKPLLAEMLGELMRLQKRAIEEKNAKAKRRVVMGLREVARGIRSHKVKMVVMANNLDEYGAIDQKLQEIIDLASSEAVPLFFEFTKRSLGKAVGKSIKVAVVGIQNADGAHQPFKKLTAIANAM
jgi:ribosomal protein L7Ae-like RNA K-turn-binding protein